MSARNVILVTVDSVRADYCGFLSDGLDTTPVLSQLQDDSIVFENAIAPGPQTLSSVPAVHTGTPFPITDHDVLDYHERISRIQNHIGSHQTIGERFQEMGYSTGCVEANPWTSTTSGFDKGYDVFKEVGGEQRKHVSERFDGTQFGEIIRTLSKWYHHDAWFAQWPHFYDEILSTVEELSEPYFLWVFLLDTHNPYFIGRKDRVESSALGMYYSMFRANSMMGGNDKGTRYADKLPPHIETRVKRAYRDSIRSVDRFVGTLRSDLQADDPMFAVYSDHGEGFGEHGLYGHQHALYEENIHVPLVLSNVGTSDRVSEPISLLQLPTVLEECATNESIDPHEWTEEYVFSRTEDSKLVAVRGDEWKGIFSSDDEMVFNLRTDPDERDDVSSSCDTLSELRTLKDEHLESLPRMEIELTAEDDDELHDRLDALGYVG